VDLQHEPKLQETIKDCPRSMKKVRVFLYPNAREACEKLKEKAPNSKIERSILNGLKNKFELIKADAECGNKVKRRRYPDSYVREYGITNLYRLELPDFWRMFYSLSNEGDWVVAYVIDIMDHNEYNRVFGRKKR